MKIDRVWLKVLGVGKGGELAAVGANVGAKTAGTFVVAAADAEPLARHLLSVPVVESARKVVERHRGTGDLSSILDAVDDLAAALLAADTAGLISEDPRSPMPEGESGPLVHARPEREIDRALRLLYHGDPDAHEGHSFFSAAAVAGVAVGYAHAGAEGVPLAFGAFNGNTDRRSVASWRKLRDQLCEMAATLDRQLAVVDALGAPIGGNRD